MKLRNLIVIIALIAVSACQQTTVRQHPDFANSWEKKYKVSVLPSEAKILYMQFDGDDKRLPEEEEKAKKVLNKQLKIGLKDKGFEVIDVNYDELFEEYPDAKFELEKLRQATDKVQEELYEQSMLPPEEAFNFRKSIGSYANIFSEYTGADLLVLANYGGFEKSDGMIAKDITTSILLGALTGYVPMKPSEAGAIELAFIDGITGDVVWTNAAATTSPLNKYEEGEEAEGLENGVFSVISPVGAALEPLEDKSKPNPEDKK